MNEKRPTLNFLAVTQQIIFIQEAIVVNQTKTKQTNPIPRSDESLMSSVSSI